jgi:hypothetical protein
VVDHSNLLANLVRIVERFELSAKDRGGSNHRVTASEVG